MRLVASWTGALISGGGISRRASNGRTFASSGLFSLPRVFVSGAALRHFSTRTSRPFIPRRRGSIDASIAAMSSIRFCAARSKALASVRAPTVPARSTSVRAGLVQGMPCIVPVSISRGGLTR
jgi:hypothetical protein